MEYEVLISKASELKPKLNKLASKGWRVTQVAVRNSDLVHVVVILERENPNPQLKTWGES